MPRPAIAARDTSIETYRARRDFKQTSEPAPSPPGLAEREPIFVVQKHAARRLHWDFRLEHGGVLWSWAVPKGPSLDPADKRLAVRTEDHPLDYADFAGTIPEGQYGAGTVEIWDRGTWQPQGDPEAGIANGELKFALSGTRLHGKFVLVRLKPRAKDRTENWLLIKERDDDVARGADAAVLEQVDPPPAKKPRKSAPRSKQQDTPPVPDAVRGALPSELAPQLATAVLEPPEGDDWLSELKFDGYRLLAFKDGGNVRLLTRKGNDWTDRMPNVARAVGRLDVAAALLDGELVALREDGVSSFPLLQQALSDGADRTLFFYVFDLLHLNGWDLRETALLDRKQALRAVSDWKAALRYSDHMRGQAGAMLRQACEMGLEGIVCKQADGRYRPGRSKAWLKVKCQGREEFIVLGFTPPAGMRTGIGSLHLGYRDPEGNLQYVGGVGTGFSDRELASLRKTLDALAADAPQGLVYAGEPPDRSITWVRPELVAEVQYVGWSGSGRIRHATYLGLREDKSAEEVMRPVADPGAPRVPYSPRRGSTVVRASAPAAAKSPPKRRAKAADPPATVVAKAPAREQGTVEGVKLTHPDRELWPGISKRGLAEYWIAVAPHALPEIAGRPLALVRCPEGIGGERFFQKRAKLGFPKQIRAGFIEGQPYLVVDDLSGLVACAQVGAIELHAWGSRERDGSHADRLVFDLDPAEDLPFTEVIRAAFEVRERLRAVGLESFCRTTGGKGLHIVAPVRPRADWTTTRAWCRAFAEAMVADSPNKYVSRLSKIERRGHILVDWLRNGLGSTAVASFSPRARPGATVATPISWREVDERLDPASFTLPTVPARLAKKVTPWAGFDELEQYVPDSATIERTPRR
ncbi:MAG: DNA ligase D, partial [Acetobacteraceae bacterium]|nr:DNA ligase D [Acetobacteraceae bacterium]